MYAMEDWLNPWTFLLPGRIKDESIQALIQTELLSHTHVIQATDSQKLLISRLTENYSKLPITTKVVLDTLVAYILKIDEKAARSVMLKVESVASRVNVDAPRHPTILILDQVKFMCACYFRYAAVYFTCIQFLKNYMINYQFRKLTVYLGIGFLAFEILTSLECHP